jgi:hypothetical protein
MEKWIKDAQNIEKIALDHDLFAKKVVAKEIFGSNLLLHKKSVRESAPNFENSLANSGETAWACLGHAHTIFDISDKSRHKVHFRGAVLTTLPLLHMAKSARN